MKGSTAIADGHTEEPIVRLGQLSPRQMGDETGLTFKTEVGRL